MRDGEGEAIGIALVIAALGWMLALQIELVCAVNSWGPYPWGRNCFFAVWAGCMLLLGLIPAGLIWYFQIRDRRCGW